MLSSIKTQIIIFFMIVLFIILSILGGFLYFSLDKIVYNSVDSGLLSKAKALATLVDNDDNETEFKFSDEIMWEYNSPKAQSFFQIRRLDGSTLEKSESLRDMELPFHAGEDQTSFETITLNGVSARLINFYFLDGNEKANAAQDKGHDLIIQCAEDIQDQIKLLKNYRMILSILILSVLIISATGGFLIAGKALSPVREMSATIEGISESNLSARITPGNIPEELRPLASSFNQAFDSLERAFNRQRQFAADASHELRTPLSVILSQSEIMLRKERTHQEYKDALTAITSAAGMMSEIVRKLLTIARMDSTKADFRIENINLSHLIRESLNLLRPLAERKGIRINVSPDEQAMVSGDRIALMELFTNLIDNAIKYNVPQGKVDVSMRKAREFIVTEIGDTGIGIPEDDLDKVFDRFYRVDRSRSRESGSIGLGLSICNEIVKVHGGRITIDSNLSSGTTVSVYLNRAENGSPPGLLEEDGLVHEATGNARNHAG
jgi:heavy metal sensor kinase